MEEIWIRDDGTVTQKGDPLGRRFVPADKHEEALALLRSNAVSQLRFPVMLRKMWSGGEVQAWLEEQAERILQEAGAGHLVDASCPNSTAAK